MRPRAAACGLLFACAAASAVAQTLQPCPPAAGGEILRQVNAARAAGRACGGTVMPPAPPVAWNDPLAAAALAHSRDMADNDYFDHVAPGGEKVSNRVSAQGYDWRTVGENIAGGDWTADGVVAGWLRSPGHCVNIMEARFVDMGVACAVGKGSTWGRYWTMVLAAPRR